MFSQNLHVHSTWDDGSHTAEEMVCAAIGTGLTSVGISVHAPMPFGGGCPAAKLPAYLEEIAALKEKYAGKIRVYTGIEWDVLSEIELKPYDYVIGSAHHLQIPSQTPLHLSNDLPPDLRAQLEAMYSVDYPGVDESAGAMERLLYGRHFGGDADALAETYFAGLEAIAQKPEVDVVGHFDLIRKFDEDRPGFRCFFNEHSERYWKAACDAMEKLVDAGKIFEINTGAIARGHRSQPYPSPKLLCILREMGGKITFSSDAHRVQDIACAYKEAEQLAKDCGFTHAYLLTEGGFETAEL